MSSEIVKIENELVVFNSNKLVDLVVYEEDKYLFPFKLYEEVKNELHSAGLSIFKHGNPELMAEYAVLMKMTIEASFDKFLKRVDENGLPMSKQYFDVSYEDGVSPAYKYAVENLVNYRAEARFWFQLSEFLSNNDQRPYFHFHCDYIIKFASMLPMHEALEYLFKAQKMLMEDKVDMPDMGIKLVLARIEKEIETKKSLIRTAIDLKQLKRDMEGEENE